MTDMKNKLSDRAQFLKDIIIDSGVPSDIDTAIAMIGAATQLLFVWEVEKHRIVAMFRDYANKIEKTEDGKLYP